MIKKNIYIGLTLTVVSTLVMLFQNCGQSNDSQAPVADGRIVVDDFLIVDSDCSDESTCKVTVAKVSRRDTIPTYPATEYDFSEKASITDEEIPNVFFNVDANTGIRQKCILVNRRDDIRYEYICNK